jgi:hypothetical protein
MVQNAILLPVFVQVLLTISIMVAMARARGRSMKARGQKIDDMALTTDSDWEQSALKASNNYKNQFEIPVLFYAVAAFALITRQVDPILFALACLFVLTRIAHAIIHIGPNQIKPRAFTFLVGVVVVIAMWIILAWRVIAGGVF